MRRVNGLLCRALCLELLDALFQIMVTNPHTLDDDSDDGEEGEFYPSEEEEDDDDVASNPEQMAID